MLWDHTDLRITLLNYPPPPSRGEWTPYRPTLCPWSPPGRAARSMHWWFSWGYRGGGQRQTRGRGREEKQGVGGIEQGERSLMAAEKNHQWVHVRSRAFCSSVSGGPSTWAWKNCANGQENWWHCRIVSIPNAKWFKFFMGLSLQLVQIILQ